MRKERNAAIELYRILLMFGIVLLHCVCQGRYSENWLRYLLGFCVPGFIVITGYFGVRFSLSKVIGLYATALYATLLAPLVGGALMRGCYWQEVLRIWDAEHGFWFVHAYVILMTVAPVVNRLFDGSVSRREIFVTTTPILFVIFFWGALINYNHLKIIVPAPVGLEAGCFFTFLGIYIIGRMIRCFGIGEGIRYRWKVLCFVLLSILIVLTKGWFSPGNNPICVLLAITSFWVVKEWRIPVWLSRVVLILSPMMFAVYCIHGTIYFSFTGAYVFSVIEWMKYVFASVGLPIPLILFGAAVGVFLIGIIAAFGARLAGILWKVGFSNFNQKVDAAYDLLCGWLADCLTDRNDDNTRRI